MELHIEGTLKKKFDIKQPSASFRYMEFVVEKEDDKYPQFIKMKVTQDKIEKFNELPVGTKAKWYFNLRGRRWDNKKGETVYFNDIVVWRYETIGTDLKPKEEEPILDHEGDPLPF